MIPVRPLLNGKLEAKLLLSKLDWELIGRLAVRVLTNKPDLELKFGKRVLLNRTRLRKSGTELEMET